MWELVYRDSVNKLLERVCSNVSMWFDGYHHNVAIVQRTIFLVWSLLPW